MLVEEVDPHDAAAFAAWFAVLEASLEAERPGEPHWTLLEQQEMALALGRPGNERSGVVLAALDGARTVGAARVVFPQRDNLRLAQLVLHVHPAERRRGAGRALLTAALERAEAQRRDVLTGELDEPLPGAPGRPFAERAGAVCGLLETRRDLLLPADAGRLAALEAACLPYAAGYELLRWRDRTPEHLLDQRAELSSRMSVEVPLGDLPFEQERWDADRLRMHEDGILAQGRTWFTVAASQGGRLVGFTDIGVPLELPERAYQWSTLVLPGHRGHRLGSLVKIAAVRDLQAASPASRLLTTYNAQSNTAMIAVNEALGFRAVGTLSQWTLPVGPR